MYNISGRKPILLVEKYAYFAIKVENQSSGAGQPFASEGAGGRRGFGRTYMDAPVLPSRQSVMRKGEIAAVHSAF
jgi:hypothetical protein